MPRIIYNSQPYRIPYMGGKQRIAYPLATKAKRSPAQRKIFYRPFWRWWECKSLRFAMWL